MKTAAKPSDVGVIVARFQVDQLHKGHIDLINYVYEQHSKVIIFLGLSPIKCSYNNPLDFEARKQMLAETKLFPNLTILYIKDMSSDKKWSNNLDEMIHDVIGPNQTVSLYGSRSSFIKHYEGKFDCIEMEQDTFVSGTKIRKQISNKVKSCPEFRKGVIWTVMNQYINATPCVNAAIMNDDESRLLLARKPNESKYRFVGGHVNPGETYERAALKEVFKETCLIANIVKYLGSHVVDDWRHRSELSDITTMLFKVKILDGTPSPEDDIEELRWFEMDEVMSQDEAILVEEHLPLFNLLVRQR